MRWKICFGKSKVAVTLEKALSGTFTLIEHEQGLSSTANSEVENNERYINLDITQQPVKCALSYAYELKNIDNAAKYKRLIDAAKNGKVSRVNFINKMLDLEAEAVLFRCQVFTELEADFNECPFNHKYMQLFTKTEDLDNNERLRAFALYIRDNGMVRKQFCAKKYYLDCFDFYAGRRSFPGFYDRTTVKMIMINHANEGYFDEVESSQSMLRQY